MKSLKADAIQCKKYGLIENIKASVQCNLDTTTTANLERILIIAILLIAGLPVGEMKRES